MADALYTHAKLGEAVQQLATGKGRVQERLIDAVPSLVLVSKAVFALPGMYQEAAAYWERIWAALTSAQVYDQHRGQAATSIDAMTEDEASAIAQSIVSLDAMVSSYVDEKRAGR